MTQVRFGKKEAEKGYSVLLHSGTVVYTDQKDVYIVPDKSLNQLKKKRVKFEVITQKEEQE